MRNYGADTIPMALLALLDSNPSMAASRSSAATTACSAHDRELRFGQVYATLAAWSATAWRTASAWSAARARTARSTRSRRRGRELDRWLATPQLPGGRPAELFTRVILALAAHRPAEAILDGQRAVYLERMRDLTARRGDGDVVDRLARTSRPTSRRTCGGSSSRAAGWPRCSATSTGRSEPAMSDDVVLRGRGLGALLRHAAGTPGRRRRAARRRDRRAHGPLRVGQVDPAAPPGWAARRPTRARSSCSAGASTACPSGSARGCGSSSSGSCSSSATWCPS